MKRSLPHLATRIFDTPLLIHPEKLDVILHVLGPRIGLTLGPPAPFIQSPVQDPDNDDDDDAGGAGDNDDDSSSNVAVIPIHGTLMKRGTGMQATSGMTSYDEIMSMVNQAMNDDGIDALMFDIDSPGGEAAGLFDLCDGLYQMRGQKPMIGISNDSAYSAAYALASTVDRMMVTKIGGVGSIGVYMLHLDRSGFDAENGLKYTYIYSGKQKVDGNPHEPLSKDVKAKFQDEVNRIRDMFVSQVARNRGVAEKDIYDTEAGVYMGDAAVPMLADETGTIGDAVSMAADMAKMKTENRSYSSPAVERRAATEKTAPACGPVGPHKTATSDKSWDGPANEARLKSPVKMSVARRSYAWIDESKASKGELPKSACRFIHHEISAGGEPGAANVQACRSGIGVLNGGRGGTTIPAGDKKGVYDHLAKHIRDAGLEPPDYRGELYANAVLAESFTARQAWAERGAELLAAARGGGWAEYADVSFDGESVLAVRQFGSTAASHDVDANVNVISGLLAPYNSLSCDMGGFREVYLPGCFSKFLQSGEDALVLGFHRVENVLGRIANGTARFWEEADGLHYEATLPDTQFARDLNTLIQRGDVRGSSAAFFITKHRWETRSGERVRAIEEAVLVEGSPHSLVAYESSTAATDKQESAAAAHDVELARARLGLLKSRSQTF